MIDDIIKAVARVRSNIEEECHEWFEDASRLADKTGATISVTKITGRQEHRNHAPSVNPESHYRVNVASFWVKGMAILLETVHTHFTATGKSYRVCKIFWWGHLPQHKVLLISIGCTLTVSSAEAERSFSGLRRIKSYLRNRMSDERLSGLALMHLHHDLDIDIDEICTIFVTKHKRSWCSKGASFTSRNQVNGKRQRNYNVQPRLVGRGVGEK